MLGRVSATSDTNHVASTSTQFHRKATVSFQRMTPTNNNDLNSVNSIVYRKRKLDLYSISL